MPIYEYQGQSCGELTEALQKMSDPPLSDCPHCGRSALRKKVSAAAFRLKGGGWYETDFKNQGRQNIAGDGADKAAGGADDKAGKAGGEAGDSKAATATDKPAAPKNTGSGETAK